MNSLSKVLSIYAIWGAVLYIAAPMMGLKLPGLVLLFLFGTMATCVVACCADSTCCCAEEDRDFNDYEDE